jgi:predicted dehydrogenase
MTECQQMFEAARTAKVKLHIGFMRRFDESFRYTKERIDEEEIGDGVLVRSLTHGPNIQKEWMLDIGKSSGPLTEVETKTVVYSAEETKVYETFTATEFQRPSLGIVKKEPEKQVDSICLTIHQVFRAGRCR